MGFLSLSLCFLKQVISNCFYIQNNQVSQMDRIWQDDCMPLEHEPFFIPPFLPGGPCLQCMDHYFLFIMKKEKTAIE
jgi:hypothetical protein